IHAGHHEVQNDDAEIVRMCLLDRGKRLLAARGEDGNISELPYGGVEQAALHRIVVNYQDRVGHECHSFEYSREGDRQWTGTLWHRLLNRHSRNPVNESLISGASGRSQEAWREGVAKMTRSPGSVPRAAEA